METPISETLPQPETLQEWTQWQRKLLEPRWFHKSKYFVPNKDEKGGNWFSETYVRPKTGNEIKGKLNIKAAKRARVKALKEAQGRL